MMSNSVVSAYVPAQNVHLMQIWCNSLMCANWQAKRRLVTTFIDTTSTFYQAKRQAGLFNNTADGAGASAVLPLGAAPLIRLHNPRTDVQQII